ncbi:hypothetical protein, partial [Enterococcus faecium]|uniref:hypothetical protein n=1 Tax=Enterococcus faecium TaxID=1352 RepID=UPI000CF06159
NSFSYFTVFLANTEGQLIEYRLYQEVVRLPFSSESQGVISKNSFSCLMTIVTCDRGVGRRATFI